jgi:uncharacterized protein with beta-barrel porin domain
VADVAMLRASCRTGATFGAFRLRAGGSATFAAIDTNRAIAFPGFSTTTRAHFGGGTGQAFGEIGYGMAFDRVAVEPFAGLAYVRVATASFLESGGLAALSGASDGENIGYASLGCAPRASGCCRAAPR